MRCRCSPGRTWPARRAKKSSTPCFLVMVGAIIGLASTDDLFNLWLWFEAMAVSSYLLVAFYRDRPGLWKQGSSTWCRAPPGLCSCCWASPWCWRKPARWAWSRFGRQRQRRPALLAAGALFVVGFGVKAALVPLHTWLPDAHSQAPSGVSAMLSGIVIEAGLVAMLRALAVAVRRDGIVGRAVDGLWRAQHAAGEPAGIAPARDQAPAGLFEPHADGLHGCLALGSGSTRASWPEPRAASFTWSTTA